VRQQLEHLSTANPSAAFALAQAWQRNGAALPDDLLKQLVTA
jgi:hypothetical protein